MKPRLDRCMDAYPEYFALADTQVVYITRDSIIRTPAVILRDTMWLTGTDSIIERTIIDSTGMYKMRIRYDRKLNAIMAECEKRSDSLKIQIHDKVQIKTQYKNKIVEVVPTWCWWLLGICITVITGFIFFKFILPIVIKSIKPI